MKEEGNLVFVYGTLKKGFGNHRLLENCQFVADAYTYGKMFGEGRFFPYAIFDRNGTEKDNIIYGEVYSVSKDVIENNLDVLEGYCPENPENSHYLRIKIDVFMGTDKTEVFAYEANRPLESFKNETPIEIF